MWYHVSEPNSYQAVTGIGIDKVRIVKKKLRLSLPESDEAVNHAVRLLNGSTSNDLRETPVRTPSGLHYRSSG